MKTINYQMTKEQRAFLESGLYNFYADNHKVNQDNRFSERVELDSLDEVKEYAERMCKAWGCEDVAIIEANSGAPIIF